MKIQSLKVNYDDREVGTLALYKDYFAAFQYSKEWKGEISVQNITLAEYIRHQIHHPENKRNKPYTPSELQQSIEEMREFLRDSQQKNNTRNTKY